MESHTLLVIDTKFYTIMLFLEIDECNSNPCKNGATCFDDVAKYICACPPGYEGVNCQTGELSSS